MSEIVIQIAKDGSPVPLWDGFCLHSLYQPIKEGESFAEKFLEENAGQYGKPLLVLGLGFGYHILPLLDKFQNIYVAESNQELINKAKAMWSENSSLPPFKEVGATMEKCVIIDDVSKAPHLPEFLVYSLRSEFRFQEKFFNEVQDAVRLADKNFVPALSQMRILVNSPIYGGSYTTAKYVETALKSLGACVHFTDHSCANGLLQKYLDSSKKMEESALITQLTELLSETLWLDVVKFKPHIVLFVAQSPFTDKLMTALNDAGIVSMYWFVEDFRRLTYWKSVCNSFDYFFMIQKGEFEEVLQKSCGSIWGWFPVGAEPRTHKKVNMSPEEKEFYGSDISFMGAAYPNRVSFFKQFKLPPLKSGEKYLKLWGTGWTESELSDYNIPLGEQRISIEQSNMIYQATKININLHSSNSGIFDINGDFVNPRTFEIAACGGFQLVDDRAAVRELFEEDVDIVFFSSAEEAVDKASFYLKNERLREKISRAGQEKVLKYHTYENRLKNMIDVAIKHSPKLTINIQNENKKLNDLLISINDRGLETFLNSIEPGMRFLYDQIIDKAYKSEGELKNHEALLMLLDTFCVGE